MAASFFVSAIQTSCSARFAFVCWLFGSLFRTFAGLMHPAALLACHRPHLAKRLPEAKRAIGDGKFRRRRQAAPLEIEQQIAPRSRALAHAVGKANQLLLALRRCADDDENALRLVLEPSLQMDAVGP